MSTINVHSLFIYFFEINSLISSESYRVLFVVRFPDFMVDIKGLNFVAGGRLRLLVSYLAPALAKPLTMEYKLIKGLNFIAGTIEAFSIYLSTSPRKGIGNKV